MNVYIPRAHGTRCTPEQFAKTPPGFRGTVLLPPGRPIEPGMFVQEHTTADGQRPPDSLPVSVVRPDGSAGGIIWVDGRWVR